MVQWAKVGAGVQGVRVLGAQHPLFHGQQRGEQVPGGGRVSRLPGPAGEVGAGAQGVRVLHAQARSYTESSAAYWSRAAAGSPASPASAIQRCGQLNGLVACLWL